MGLEFDWRINTAGGRTIWTDPHTLQRAPLRIIYGWPVAHHKYRIACFINMHNLWGTDPTGGTYSPFVAAPFDNSLSLSTDSKWLLPRIIH